MEILVNDQIKHGDSRPTAVRREEHATEYVLNCSFKEDSAKAAQVHSAIFFQSLLYSHYWT